MRPPTLSAISTHPSCAGSFRSVKYFGNSTDSIGMYRPVAARSTNASVRNTLLFQTNFRPSTMPAKTPSGRAVRSGLPAPSRRSTPIATIDNPKADAGTPMGVTPPAAAGRQPEGRRGHAHGVDATHRGDQQAADARADDVGQIEYRLVHAVG